GQDQQVVDVLEDLVGVVAEQLGGDGFDVLQGVAHGTRLFEDLFLHVVAIGPQLGGSRVRMYGVHSALDLASVGVDDPDARQLQVDHVAILKIDDLVGGAGQRQGVGGQEILVLTASDHQRRALARADDSMGFVAAEDGDGIGAFKALRGLPHGGEQVAIVAMVDQVGDDFGVGLAFELVAGGAQLAAQFVVVLDDAVVDQRDARLAAALAREMGMGVVGGRRAVGGPAGMGNAGEAGEFLLLDFALELGHALSAARAAQAAVGVHRHAAGVVAAVFEALEALDQNGGYITLRDCADDSTHSFELLKFAQQGLLCSSYEEIRFLIYRQ